MDTTESKRKISYIFKGILILNFFLLPSCVSTKANNKATKSLNKNYLLILMSDYKEESSKSLRSIYQDINLQIEFDLITEDERYFLNNELIFIEKERKCSIQVETFNDFLLIQKSLNTTQFQPSTLFHFDRSEFFIFNVHSNEAFYLKLEEPINLYHSKDNFIRQMGKVNDITFRLSKTKAYIIEDIDFTKKTITFFGLNHKLKTYTLSEIEELPVTCDGSIN